MPSLLLMLSGWRVFQGNRCVAILFLGTRCLLAARLSLYLLTFHTKRKPLHTALSLSVTSLITCLLSNI